MSDLTVALFGAAGGLSLGLVTAIAVLATFKPTLAKDGTGPAVAKSRRFLSFYLAVMPGMMAAGGAFAALRLFGSEWWR